MCEFEQYGRLHCMQSWKLRHVVSRWHLQKPNDCRSIHHHVIFAAQTKAFTFKGSFQKQHKSSSSRSSFTCREMSSFRFGFLLRRRRHVCTDLESAAGRKRSVWQTKIPALFFLKSWTNTSVWNVNVAFSWALFGNGAWWRHAEPSGSWRTWGARWRHGGRSRRAMCNLTGEQ